MNKGDLKDATGLSVSVPCRGTTFLNIDFCVYRIFTTLVSVPCRGTTFLNCFCKSLRCKFSNFRPLSGNYISQSDFCTDINKTLTGLFPSPVGELHFSIDLVKRTAEFNHISVPCRGTTFLNKNKETLDRVVSLISVPCRGTTFLNCDVRFLCLRVPISVPCRGTTFLNDTIINHETSAASFPSPVGELHFSIRADPWLCDCVEHDFRPLSGNYISQSYRNPSIMIIKTISVPCRGTTFLNTKTIITKVNASISVPCRGTTFLNQPFAVSKKESLQNISVPCRGTTFLNCYFYRAD